MPRPLHFCIKGHPPSADLPSTISRDVKAGYMTRPHARQRCQDLPQRTLLAHTTFRSLPRSRIHFNARAAAQVNSDEDLMRIRRDRQRYRLAALQLRSHLAVDHHLVAAEDVTRSAAFTPEDDHRTVVRGIHSFSPVLASLPTAMHATTLAAAQPHWPHRRHHRADPAGSATWVC